MGTQIYSALFLAVLAVAAFLSLRRPFAGLLVLVALSPFYAILRETSTGSAVFFIWPYLLIGILWIAIAFREMAAVLERRGLSRGGPKLLAIALTAVLVVAGTLEATSGAIRAVTTDTSLSSMTRVLGGQPFAWTVALAGVCAVLFLALFFTAMRKREGRTNLLDVIVGMFLIYGAFQVLNTSLRNGLLFTGLNGLRYYYIASAVYFPARYLVTDRERHRQFLVVILAACLAGATQMLMESYLLNARGVPPAQMPWGGGQLFERFGFAPDPARTDFEGVFPVGFMYFTHMSGLFLLLGIAVCVPRSLVARHWREAAPYVLLLALLVTAAVWTSRTVLLLMLGTYVIGALLVHASWVRRVGGLAALIVFMFVSSSYLIPGARYDLAQVTRFLATRAVSSAVFAIDVDLRQIAGVELAPSDPYGWRLVAGRGKVRPSPEQARSGAVSLAVIADDDLAEYRDIVLVTPALSGRRVRAEAWVKAFPGSHVFLQIHDDRLVRQSATHSSNGGWELLVARLERAPESGSLGVDIDVEAHGTAFVDRVSLHIEGEAGDGAPITLFGELPPLAPSPAVAAPPQPVVPAPAVQSCRPEPPTWDLILFGRGAQFADWNLVFFGETRPSDSFAVASYSDTKYLEFAQQFGLVGLLLLLLLGATAVWQGMWLTLRERDDHRRADHAAVTLMAIVAFVSLFHLPSLFLIGFGVSIFVALATLAGGSTLPVQRIDQ